MKYENFEKWDMLVCFVNSNENPDAASLLYLERYPERTQPQKDIFRRLKNNLITCGRFEQERPKNYSSHRDRELEEIVVLGAIENNPQTSTRKLPDITGVRRSRARRVLKKYNYKPYRTRAVHHLNPGDFERRTQFSQWFIDKCTENRNFPINCIWTDESHISSAGIFNRYNSYSWAQQNPHVIVERRHQGRFGFSVWAGIYRGRIVGPFIYDGALTSARYLQILQDYIDPLLDEIPLVHRQNVFFQHDGAPPHNAAIVNNFLTETFGNNWLANQGPNLWPARSPDMTPMDFFLWGKLKDLIYKMPANNRQELEFAVRAGFASLRPAELLNSARSVEKRCRLCIANNGRQFENQL